MVPFGRRQDFCEVRQHWKTDVLLILADALKTGTPGPQGPDVAHQGVGTCCDNFFFDSHTTVYLAGGAFVFANQAADQRSQPAVMVGTPGHFESTFQFQTLCDCDLQGRKLNFTNSKTLVSRSSRALPLTCPNVSNLFFFEKNQK